MENIENGPHFTQLCQTKDGEQWTDYHRTMEQLVLLGIANNSLIYPLPKGMWMLTGGLPYVIRKKE